MTVRRTPTIRRGATTVTSETDILLIGGGIMSTTLAAMLALDEPTRRITLVERAGSLAAESSSAWNNAGTGHSGYCELNYMPDPEDPRGPQAVADLYARTRDWWSALERRGLLDTADFLHPTPHIDLVFGNRDVEYLRRRFATLVRDPRFRDMEYTEDPDVIAQWAPLTMRGRHAPEPMAATRHRHGTDIDFGALTRTLGELVARSGGTIATSHEVRRLYRRAEGGWTVTGKNTKDGGAFRIHAAFVFVGAGGRALRLLQQGGVPEVRGYGVLPVGAGFFRCSRAEVVEHHEGKVYGQADVGAPPMSVPHLDKRMVDGRGHVMFGPYAMFSTRLLKHGSLVDFFATLQWHNLPVLAAALRDNLGLVRYLIGQLLASDRRKFAQLRRFYPEADRDHWEFFAAGQRAQLVTPDPDRGGALRSGTELVMSEDRSIAGLLGASPGASVAVPAMEDLVRECFPQTKPSSAPRLPEAPTSGSYESP
ncbi:malate:quinone oxidoreductase [Rhodococcus sp. HNM0569]|uniref:malate:quinone oxidoreductase n=1 Tax=Rhodococcus sp. HNM0569 TaxID=2716340 RepID=UPI00146F2EF0|nr:malate:quinone oxidoreductase [Rhodococcus sp. HNM0569]NLU84424.1 malate:quinone oxidoreductase [Rhodococcus sp. HNM0569]